MRVLIKGERPSSKIRYTSRKASSPLGPLREGMCLRKQGTFIAGHNIAASVGMHRQHAVQLLHIPHSTEEESITQGKVVLGLTHHMHMHG